LILLLDLDEEALVLNNPKEEAYAVHRQATHSVVIKRKDNFPHRVPCVAHFSEEDEEKSNHDSNDCEVAIRACKSLVSMLVPEVRTQAEPAELIFASTTEHVLASSILRYHNPALWTWLFEKEVPKISEV